MALSTARIQWVGTGVVLEWTGLDWTVLGLGDFSYASGGRLEGETAAGRPRRKEEGKKKIAGLRVEPAGWQQETRKEEAEAGG
jgi:hypothetical protein